MDQNSQQPLPKGHIKSFWPLVIIFVLAVVAAGLVYWFEFNLSTDYDLQSMSFSVQRRLHNPAVPEGGMPIKGVEQPTSTAPTGK